MILIATQVAGRLGGGKGVDIAVGRIVLAFLLCSVIAFLATLLIRQRFGRSPAPRLFRPRAFRGNAIDIVEVRRLSIHADVGLVRHAGREYLLLVQSGHHRILSEADVADDAGALR